MLCKRFIGSGKHLIDNIRITQAALDTLQTNAGFTDYLPLPLPFINPSKAAKGLWKKSESDVSVDDELPS